MIKPDPRAGGCLLSVAIIAGFMLGLANRDPVGGAILGTVVGIVAAALVWFIDRRRGPR